MEKANALDQIVRHQSQEANAARAEEPRVSARLGAPLPADRGYGLSQQVTIRQRDGHSENTVNTRGRPGSSSEATKAWQ